MKIFQVNKELILSNLDAFATALGDDPAKLVPNFISEIVNKNKIKKPTIVFTAFAANKYRALVKLCAVEIAWHGIVEYNPDNETYTVTDILVYPQEGSPTFVTSRDEEYATWMSSLDDQSFYSLRLQGHSHVNMGVSPSATDVEYYHTLKNGVKDFYIVMIANKSDLIHIELWDASSGLVFERADINLVFEEDKYTDWAKASMESNFILKSLPPVSLGHTRNFPRQYYPGEKEKEQACKVSEETWQVEQRGLFDFNDEEYDDYLSSFKSYVRY